MQFYDISCIHTSRPMAGCADPAIDQTIIKLKHECKKCAFCWFLLHMYRRSPVSAVYRGRKEIWKIKEINSS